MIVRPSPYTQKNQLYLDTGRDLITTASGLQSKQNEKRFRKFEDHSVPKRSMLKLRPRSSLVDKITKINVSRLKPLQNITLGAEIVGDKGIVFESHAHFIADKDGEVDVCRDSSLGGSYSGVSPMGLLWSMKPAPGQRKGIRLMKSDVTKPYNIVLNCFDDHVTPSKPSLKPLSSLTFQKWYMAEGVKRIPVREGRIRGTLFLPPGDGPFPGMKRVQAVINSKN